LARAREIARIRALSYFKPMSNFVFTRREIQRTLNGLGSVLTREQLAKLVDDLNRAGSQRLPAMWEVMVLHGFAGVGGLVHEEELPNGRKPDIKLPFPVLGDVNLIGDVTAVSDAGLDERNPVDMLHDEVMRLAGKCGLRQNSFRYDVRGGYQGKYGDQRGQLHLPARGQLSNLIKARVEPWVRSLQAAPNETSKLVVRDEGVDFTLTYDPSQPYAGGSYLSYDTTYSRDKNPLFNALRGKVDQVRGAREQDLRMIIACDGDCALMRGSSLSVSQGGYSAGGVAKDFLRQNTSVDVVLLFGIEESTQIWPRDKTLRIKRQLVASEPNIRSGRLSDATLAAVDAVCRAAHARMPTPVMTAYNAVHRLREPGFGMDGIGGLQWGGRKVKISKRVVQRLLAGDLDSKAFAEAYEWDGRKPNPFKAALAQGRLIEDVKVIPRENRDDDWLEFTFGAPDAGASPFKVPGDGESR
jgi:hypothetical protein